MFTGIIKKTGIVKIIKPYKNGLKLGIKTGLNISSNEIGASINCSGVCLTLEKISKKICYFYLSKETLAISNFSKIRLSNVVNLEKSLKFGDKISGHFVQGHVDTTSKLKEIKLYGKSWYLYFSMNKKLKKFLAYKGSIAINGISLTIAKVLSKTFLVCSPVSSGSLFFVIY